MRKLKAKVAIEAVKGLNTINEIVAHFEVAPTQVFAWKRQFLEASAETFKNLRCVLISYKRCGTTI